MVQAKDGMSVAIEIARILAKAPEERLPMIISVFEEYGLTIEGLEELADWKASEGHGFVMDLTELLEEIKKKFTDVYVKDEYRIPAAEFSAWLREKSLNPLHVKKALAGKKLLRTNGENGKLGYTCTVRNQEGKLVRCIVIKTGGEKHDKADKAAVHENLGDA